MDFVPRHAQPFTMTEAIHLDPSVIADEIGRLQNSLKHLKETQVLLREHIQQSTERDVDIEDAARENEETIGSQEERITMLKLALVEKGILLPSSHYALPGENPSIAASQRAVRQAASVISPEFPRASNEAAVGRTDEEGGIDL